MSLISTERALCDKMVGEFDTLVNPVFAAKGAIKEHKRNLRNTLSNMIFSPPNAVQNEANALKNAAYDYYPGSTVDDMYALKRLIDNCDYLAGAAPVANILGTALGVFSNMDRLISNSTIPEFGAALIGGIIDRVLNGIGVPGGNNLADILRRADSLINCLALVCGPGDAYYITAASEYALTTDDLYSELNVVSDPNDPNYGKFDYQSVYDDVGMDLQQQTNINSALSGVTDMHGNATTAINDSVTQVKQLTAEGFF